MKIVNYKETINQLSKYCAGRIHIMEVIKDDELKSIYLDSLRVNQNTNQIINDFEVTELENFCILEYDSTDINENKQYHNIIVYEECTPLFQINHMEKGINHIVYEEDIYTTYKANSNHIASRLKRSSTRLGPMEHLKVSILDESTEDSKTYYQKNYKFYLENDQIEALQLDDEMYIQGENAFTNRLNSSLKKITQVTNKIKRVLDSHLEEKVKTYKIIRKKQGR